MSNFKSVAEKIRSLENDRRNLVLEIEELKKLADSKAKALESEVSMLREEVRSLRMILGTSETEQEVDPKKKPLRR
jgi:regulator of replication initiation timing